MARKPVVDREVVLTMLQEGSSTQQVADHFHVSRQAIDLHRRDFIRQGVLKDIRAPRKSRHVPAPDPVFQPDVQEDMPRVPKPPTGNTSTGVTASLDDLIELLITAFTALKRVPELEAQVAQYRDAYQRTLKEVERLSKDIQRRKDQEQRWNLTQQLNLDTWPREGS